MLSGFNWITACCSSQDHSLHNLCLNVLYLHLVQVNYSRRPVDFAFTVSEIAAVLNVKPRRIYDIINVMEVLGILVRDLDIHNNAVYRWLGTSNAARALDALKAQAKKVKADCLKVRLLHLLSTTTTRRLRRYFFYRTTTVIFNY